MTNEPEEKTAKEVWEEIGGEVGNSEHLAELLERVGPEKYNEFIHTPEYVHGRHAEEQSADVDVEEEEMQSPPTIPFQSGN